MKVDDDLLQRWRSLGIMFARSHCNFADPEKTILDSLFLILDDAKMLFLITNWMRQHGDLIHGERLLSLVKARALSYDELMTLGGLADYANSFGHRLRSVLRYVNSKVQKGHVVKTSAQVALPVQLGQCPPEPSFERYGIRVPTIIDLSAKILDTKLIVQTNVWLRNRLFFGCNWRADIYTALRRKKKARTSTYRLAKELGCSNETALRIRKNFELLENIA